MKKIKWMPLLFAAVCGLLFAFSACGEHGDQGKLAPTDASKVLVAYFSATGTTKGVAEKVAQASGGTLYEIVPQVPYTQEDLNYSDGSTRATREQRDPAARPEIVKTLSDLEGYSVVYLGYPIWWGEAPKLICTFLETYDFSGKTVVPFCTSGSSPIGSSATNLHSLASGATWLAGERFSSTSSQSEVEEWVNGLTQEGLSRFGENA